MRCVMWWLLGGMVMLAFAGCARETERRASELPVSQPQAGLVKLSEKAQRQLGVEWQKPAKRTVQAVISLPGLQTGRRISRHNQSGTNVKVVYSDRLADALLLIVDFRELAGILCRTSLDSSGEVARNVIIAGVNAPRESFEFRGND